MLRSNTSTLILLLLRAKINIITSISHFVLLFVQDRMSYNQNQNNDSVSSYSTISNYSKPDLDSKFDNLNKNLLKLKTNVEKITAKSNKD